MESYKLIKMLEKLFDFKKGKHRVKTEVIAGMTTFMTMAYILAVNPDILSVTGMDKGALFTATAISAIVGTLIMALVAKLPFALAPGMGLNAFFAFTIVLSMGYSWQFALTAVFIEGLLFILLTAFNIRKLIIDAIPIHLKHAISVGIGLFIAFIGLQNAGIVVNNDSVLVGLGDMLSSEVWVGLFGVIVSAVLLVRRCRGALLIGVFSSTVLAIFLGVSSVPESGLVSAPPSLEPLFFKLDFSNVISFDMLIILLSLLFIDMFDTVGTLVGVSDKGNMLTPEGNVPKAKQALFADAIGTTFGSLIGTSTVTTYVESASGISEGGRSGLTSFTVAILFALSLLFSPLFLLVPPSATAPALFMVGLLMISPIVKINLNDISEALPAFITILFMPLTYSIAEGIVFGMLSYVAIKVFTGKHKDLSVTMYVLAFLFLLKFFV